MNKSVWVHDSVHSKDDASVCDAASTTEETCVLAAEALFEALRDLFDGAFVRDLVDLVLVLIFDFVFEV
jgi:hypothetical protein